MALGFAVLMVAGAAKAATNGGAKMVDPSDVKVDQWNLMIGGETLKIDPPSEKSASVDAALKEGTPGWGGPVYQPGPAWAYGALRADSLVVTLADDAKTKLEVGKDFALDPAWATVAAVQGSKYPAGTKVHMEYKYGMSRIDLVERTGAGKLAVVKGTEDKSEPLIPQATAGSTPVLTVYLPNGARELSMKDVNIIDPTYDGVPPVTGTEELKGVKEKIASGKPVTIVFLGDSITAQKPADFRDGKGSFVDRFGEYLRTTHPGDSVEVINYGNPVPASEDKQILVVKAGVGGDDTVRALARLDKDVIARKPDAVVVMLGVNDENRKGEGNDVPVAKYKTNIETIVKKSKAAGAEVVLMTPSMKNLDWSGTVGNMKDYAAAMREVAAAEKVCLVDNFSAWQQLPKRGYNYMVFLGNCINHPVDLGHDLFFRGLKAAFEK